VRPGVLANFLALLLAGHATADPLEAERQVERALIERDRQAAEFSRPELRNLPRKSDAEPLRSDERVLRSRERDAYLLSQPPAPQAPPPVEAPLPLPGGAGHGVDPIPVPGPRG
jgi:hypothetical protein